MSSILHVQLCATHCHTHTLSYSSVAQHCWGQLWEMPWWFLQTFWSTSGVSHWMHTWVASYLIAPLYDCCCYELFCLFMICVQMLQSGYLFFALINAMKAYSKKIFGPKFTIQTSKRVLEKFWESSNASFCSCLNYSTYGEQVKPKQ